MAVLLWDQPEINLRGAWSIPDLVLLLWKRPDTEEKTIGGFMASISFETLTFWPNKNTDMYLKIPKT